MIKLIFRAAYASIMLLLISVIFFTEGYEFGYDHGRVSVAFEIAINGKTPEQVCTEVPQCCNQIRWCKERKK